MNAEDVLDECGILQLEELEVIESIYPDYISHTVDDDVHMIALEIPIQLSLPHQVSVSPTLGDVPPQNRVDSPSPPLQDGDSTAVVSSLPSILLHVTLPGQYPSQISPRITSIYASHSWLPRLSVLMGRLLGMWQKEEGVLYAWIDYIESGRFLGDIGILEQDRIIRISHAAPHMLVPILKNHDISTTERRFDQMSYSCSVCLVSVKGARCVLLTCKHVFCRGCLEDFWKLCIAEGDVARVTCPDPECVKAQREATEDEVRRIVNDEELKRWKWLKEKRMLDKDPTIIHCPVQLCQTPVSAPANIDLEESSGWNRLRTCPSCAYSFCAFCRRTWHGPISHCPLSVTDSFVDEYMAAPEHSLHRKRLEQRYGRANITRLVARRAEEKANAQWLKDSATPCPSCQVYVEKSHGCNHMTCSKCGCHFCYRCGDRISQGNPYAHFSTPGYSCFSKLFDHAPQQDDGWQPMEGFAYI